MATMLRFLAILLLCTAALARVLNLIEQTAEMVTHQQIMNAFPKIAASTPIPLFSLLHWSRDVTAKHLNELLQTDIKTDVEGAQLCDTPICDESLCIRACIASMNEGPVEGTKIADLCSTTSDVICVGISSSELQYAASSHAMGLMQAVLREKAQTASRVKLFIFVFGSPEGDEDADVQRASDMVRLAWDDLESKEAVFDDVVEARAHAVSPRHSARVTAARSELADALRTTTRMSLQSIADNLPSAWSVIARNPAKPFVNAMQRTALFRVDRAYEAAIRQVERLSQQWIQRADSKKIVAGFGERAGTLAERALSSFDDATVGVSAQRHRAQRRRELLRHIEELYRTLFNQQATMLQDEATQQLRNALLKVARHATPAGDTEEEPDTVDGVQVTEVEAPEKSVQDFMARMSIPPEREAFVTEFFGLVDTIPSTKNLPLNELQTFDALLQVDYELFSRLKELEVPSVGILAAETMTAAQRALRDYVDKFPSTPAAQAVALQDTEDQLENPPQARSLSIRPRLDFVISVEAPGYGNLQGYTSYAFDFGTVWLAFSNDRDKDTNLLFPPGPMLRIQPKLHFDIDRK